MNRKDKDELGAFAVTLAFILVMLMLISAFVWIMLK